MTTNNRTQGNNSPFHNYNHKHNTVPQPERTRSRSHPLPEMQTLTPTKRYYDDTNIPSFNQASIQNGPSTLNLVQNGPSTLNLNPALLLNPKGYVAPAPTARQDAASMSFNNSNNSAGVEFQFANPHDGFTSAGQSLYSNGHATPPPNNFVDMMDRMNNVEQRMFVPQSKRRKLEAEHGIDPARAFGNGGSGDVGQYLRERRQDAPTQQRTTGPVEAIDLTDAG